MFLNTRNNFLDKPGRDVQIKGNLLVIDSASHAFPASARPTNKLSSLCAVGIPCMTATYNQIEIYFKHISPDNSYIFSIRVKKPFHP